MVLVFSFLRKIFNEWLKIKIDDLPFPFIQINHI